MKPILTSLAALGMVGLLAACQEEQHAEAPAPRPVLSVVVAPQTARTVGFAGTVEPRYKSDLGFRVLGRIVSRDVNVGDVVKKGQRLATLDPLAYQLAVRSAQADLASATARLENAAATETRQRTLLQQNIATQAQFEPPSSPRVRGGRRHPRQGRTSTRPRSNSATPSFAPTSTVSSPPPRRSSGRWSSRDRRSSRCGSPGHPGGGGRPAREHRAGSQAGSPLRHRPAAGSLGAGCRIGAGDRPAGGSRHPHAAGEDHPRQPTGELPSRNDDHRHGHDAGCPGHRAAGLGPAGAGRQDDGLGRRPGHPDGVDPGRDDCRPGRILRPGPGRAHARHARGHRRRAQPDPSQTVKIADEASQ